MENTLSLGMKKAVSILGEDVKREISQAEKYCRNLADGTLTVFDFDCMTEKVVVQKFDEKLKTSLYSEVIFELKRK